MDIYYEASSKMMLTGHIICVKQLCGFVVVKKVLLGGHGGYYYLLRYAHFISEVTGPLPMNYDNVY